MSESRITGHTHQQRSEAVRYEEEVHEFAEGEEDGHGEESLADEGQVELVPLGPGQVDVVVALDVDVRHDPEHEGGREEDEHHQRVPDARQLTAHTWFTVGDGLVNTHTWFTVGDGLVNTHTWFTVDDGLVNTHTWFTVGDGLVNTHTWFTVGDGLVNTHTWFTVGDGLVNTHTWFTVGDGLVNTHTWFTVGDGLVNTHYDSHLVHSRRWISEHSLRLTLGSQSARD